MQQPDILSAGGAQPSAFVRLVAGALAASNEVLAQNSRDVDASTSRLADLFRGLSTESTAQTARLSDLAQDASFLTINGERVALMDLPALIQRSIDDTMQRIALATQHGNSLVRALDGVLEEIRELESWVVEIAAINHQTKLLSMNARIESERLNSPEFKVVSSEMNHLSKQVDSLSGRMRRAIAHLRDHVLEVIREIKADHQMLGSSSDPRQEIKAYVDALMNAMVDQNHLITSSIERQATASHGISNKVGEIVTTMQFQDRVRQRADAVCEALDAIARFVKVSPNSALNEQACNELGYQIVDRTKLSDVRRLFAEKLLGAAPPEKPLAAGAAGGDIELF